VALLPITLDLTDRLCVIVGGGEVAGRKVRDALAADARVRVVSPEVDPSLEALAAAGRIELRRARFAREHLDGASLVFVATDDEAVNEAAARAAKALGTWVNVADRPALCDFYVPATVRRGDLLIAISTSGKSPALAARARRTLEREFGPEYGHLLRLMGDAREAMARREGLSQKERQAIYERILDSDVLTLLAQGRDEDAAALVRSIAEGGGD
jgi:precorrin-2 dehydrogenase / sirohydrochlorin ferrochelatase